MNDAPPPRSDEDRRAGLCASCRHAQVILSSRGSRFYLCRLSNSDPRYARYPGLPVLECAGHDAVATDTLES